MLFRIATFSGPFLRYTRLASLEIDNWTSPIGCKNETAKILVFHERADIIVSICRIVGAREVCSERSHSRKDGHLQKISQSRGAAPAFYCREYCLERQLRSSLTPTPLILAFQYDRPSAQARRTSSLSAYLRPRFATIFRPAFSPALTLRVPLASFEIPSRIISSYGITIRRYRFQLRRT